MDYTALSGAVDFSGAVTAGASIAAAVIAVYVAVKGAKLVYAFIR